MEDAEGGQLSETASGSDQGSEPNPSSDGGSSRGDSGDDESRTDNSNDENMDETSDEETDEDDDQDEGEVDEGGPSISRRDKGKGRYVSPPDTRDEALAREIQAAEYNRIDDLQAFPEPLTIEPRLNRFAPYTSHEVASITSRIQRRAHSEQGAHISSIDASTPFPWATRAAARGPLAHKRDSEAILALADAFLVRQPRANLFSSSADKGAYMRSLHAIFSIATDIYSRAVPESSRTGIPVLAQLMLLASRTRADAGMRLNEPMVAEGSGDRKSVV